MHCPSQSSCAGSEHPHLPRKHFSLAAHAFPQAPQFASSKRRLTHWSLQMASVVCGQAQTPSWHSVPPMQWPSQPPQLLLSDWVSTHPAGQSSLPSGQVQTPFWQERPPLQTMPQPPQLLLSCWTSAHVVPPQQAWPGSQQLLPHATSPSIVSQHRPASLQNPVPCRQTLPG
jgi:hypothetical protein